MDNSLDITARTRFGIDGIFPYQRLVMTNILEAAAAEEGRDSYRRQIVILPTGSGKSLCFMLPALLLEGLSVLIFPLLALMNDQIRRLEEAGIPVECWRGGQKRSERNAALERLHTGESRILVTNPEILATTQAKRQLQDLPIAHIVIDEVHTITDWGETFRPAMLDLPDFFLDHPQAVLTAFTATASPAVLKRIQDVIFGTERAHIIQGNPDRQNIHYRTIPTLSKQALLPQVIRRTKEPLLIFCSSRRGTMRRVLELKTTLQRDDIFFYHAGLSPEEKEKIETWFFQSEKGILLATCAYGMGVDKKDIRTVIHADLPLTPEAFLQETGRGGRDGELAETILLFSQEDINRIENLKDPYQRQRAEEMLRYALNANRCRREAIFDLFDHRQEECSGCDICDGTAEEEPPEWVYFRNFFHHYNKILSPEEAVFLLKGYDRDRRFPARIYKKPGEGALREWTLEALEETVVNLAAIGLLRKSRILWKNKLLWKPKKKEWPGFRIAEKHAPV